MTNIDEHIFRSPTFEGVVNDAIAFFKLTPICDLPPDFDFYGSGVYALYYHGDFPLYAKLVQKSGDDFNIPIYIGKAVPPGWRTNRIMDSTKPVLKQRLREHSRTIIQCSSLEINRFKCRFVILNGVESDLIGALEAGLIRCYSPLWNNCIDGFGDHDPGDKRYDGKHTEWDTIHPGRSWTSRMRGERRELRHINQKIFDFMNKL
jgi:hypothetical protein